MEIANNSLRDYLSNVYWLCGTACSGKTTTARRLAAKYNMIHYNADNEIVRHMKLANSENQPAMSEEFTNADEYFNRPVIEWARWILDINREDLNMIVPELIQLSKNQSVVIEGHFPPDIVTKIARENQAVFMFAKEDLIINDYFRREDKKNMLNAIKSLSNSDTVMNHTFEVIKIVAKEQLKMGKESGLKRLERTKNSSVEETLNTVEAYFTLS